ncbi:hypothetical protein [Spirochaeta isovalerica]|uniref:Uncharacterized protein n=1 Tax=Spirochaeta isovalerica TaxID=150 RepID=A0A841RDT5_9SPIO|nr:hypothetical protein [Spirochaeta isovalerica]MBB6482143.1 hypothetical protein [Spirochaeta isovalerica]
MEYYFAEEEDYRNYVIPTKWDDIKVGDYIGVDFRIPIEVFRANKLKPPADCVLVAQVQERTERTDESGSREDLLKVVPLENIMFRGLLPEKKEMMITRSYSASIHDFWYQGIQLVHKVQSVDDLRNAMMRSFPLHWRKPECFEERLFDALSRADKELGDSHFTLRTKFGKKALSELGVQMQEQ